MHHAQLSESINQGSQAASGALSGLAAGGLTPEQALGQVNLLVNQQAFMLAANDVFFVSALMFLALIPLVWLSHPQRAAHRGRRQCRRALLEEAVGVAAQVVPAAHGDARRIALEQVRCIDPAQAAVARVVPPP